MWHVEHRGQRVSTQLFPTGLKGLDIDVERTATFSTLIQTSASGKEQRASFWTAPRWTYEWTLNFVRQAGFSAKTLSDELLQLQSFFNAMRGAWDSFYFIDPVNGSPSACLFGTGTGAQTVFQLVDNEGFSAGIIQSAAIYVAGVLQSSGVSYNATTGVVTFTTAPASAAALTWTGQFARVCRFVDDTMTFKRFVNLAWDGGTVKVITLK
jgi:uncharacterized protein (TIGR02217 family)